MYKQGYKQIFLIEFHKQRHWMTNIVLQVTQPTYFCKCMKHLWWLRVIPWYSQTLTKSTYRRHLTFKLVVLTASKSWGNMQRLSRVKFCKQNHFNQLAYHPFPDKTKTQQLKRLEVSSVCSQLSDQWRKRHSQAAPLLLSSSSSPNRQDDSRLQQKQLGVRDWYRRFHNPILAYG